MNIPCIVTFPYGALCCVYDVRCAKLSYSHIRLEWKERPQIVHAIFKLDNNCYQWGFFWHGKVIHRRVNGRLDFFRDWEAYRNGFGYNSGEMWLGNEVIHAISAQARYELLVMLEDWQFTFVEAHYRHFYVGSEMTNYTLRVAGFTGGPAGIKRGDIEDAIMAEDWPVLFHSRNSERLHNIENNDGIRWVLSSVT